MRLFKSLAVAGTTLLFATSGANADLIAQYAPDELQPAGDAAYDFTAADENLSGPVVLDRTHWQVFGTSSTFPVGPGYAMRISSAGEGFTITVPEADSGFITTITSIDFLIVAAQGSSLDNQAEMHYSLDDGDTPLGSIVFDLHEYDHEVDDLPPGQNVTASFAGGIDVTGGAELSFLLDEGADTTPHVRLETIDINGSVVPEPGSLALLGLGSLMMLRRRRA